MNADGSVSRVSRVQQHLRPCDKGENRGTQERNDFLFSQIITEGLSLAVHCFHEGAHLYADTHSFWWLHFEECYMRLRIQLRSHIDSSTARPICSCQRASQP